MTRSLLITICVLANLLIVAPAYAVEQDPALIDADVRVVELVKSVQATFNYQIAGQGEAKQFALTPAVLGNYIETLESLLTASELSGDQIKNNELLEQLAGAIEGLANLEIAAF